MTKPLPYSIILYPDPEQGGYAVTIPAFPGLFAEGESRDAAISAARDAIARRIQEMQSKDLTLPEREAEPEIRVVDVAQILNLWV